MEASYPPGLDAGKHGAEDLMGRREAPTAIIAHKDIVAMGAITGLKAMGLKVPEDVSVVGFDDILYASSESLSLTTLRQDPRKQAELAVNELLARIDDRSLGGRDLILIAELQIRGSISPPR